MNRDDIISMAEKAGCGWIRTGAEPALFGEKQITRFANLVAELERAECVFLCDDMRARCPKDSTDSDVLNGVADLISARGKK